MKPCLSPLSPKWENSTIKMYFWEQSEKYRDAASRTPWRSSPPTVQKTRYVPLLSAERTGCSATRLPVQRPARWSTALWKLQRLYKEEIKEDEPDLAGKERMTEAIKANSILFFGAYDEKALIGCCSVTVGFSTFNYLPSGVFEDFYILPEYRHKGIAHQLVQFARLESGVSSLTVGCADCDVQMYKALGFSIPIGNLLAFDWQIPV